MRQVVFRNQQAPGDILMLTAAVRDLHLCHPEKFQTDVRTPFPDLWLNNPYLTPLECDGPEVEVIDCHYPLITRSNERPVHFLHGFADYIGETLNCRITPMAFRGDIHLLESEKYLPKCVDGALSDQSPFWIIAAGGKEDYTIKWWAHERFQKVVDLLRGEIQFVQIGAHGHHHRLLDGVIDLRGKTSLRDLVRLTYLASGVVCPVTFLMHLAAAVQRPGGSSQPCVVIAGGREPPNWEAYPTHQFIHTVGALHCCAQGGCWRSRTKPLGDGDIKDLPRNLCVDVVYDLPRCMDMITPEAVVERIRYYKTRNIASTVSL